MGDAVIHIGTHKTATTMIQNTLALNGNWLAKRGLIYPKIGRAAGHHVLTTEWIKTLPPVYQSASLPTEDWQAIPPWDGTLLLSSEEFSRASPDHVNWAELRELLPQADRIRVLCVLRNQIDFIQSAYLEVTKTQDIPSVGMHLAEILNPRIQDQLYFDYNTLWDRLTAAFPPEDIVMMSYDAAKQHKGGILQAIFDRLELTISADELRASDDRLANRSPEPLVAWIAHQISRPWAADKTLLTAVAHHMKEVLGERQSCVFSRAEVKRLSDHFTPLNQRFEANVRKTDPDFRMGALRDLKDIVHRDMLPAQVPLRVARQLYQDAAA